MLPSLFSLSLEPADATGVQPTICKKRVVKPIWKRQFPDTGDHEFLSVLYMLKNHFNLKRLPNDPGGIFSVNFRYAPNPKTALASFTLSLHFDDKQLQMIILSQGSGTENCVTVRVTDEGMNVISLYFSTRDKASRKLCNFKRLDATGSHMDSLFEHGAYMDTHGAYLGGSQEDAKEVRKGEGDKEVRKGEGAIVLGALVSIAAAFDVKVVSLYDVAEFFDTETSPFWGKVGVTKYLRKVRGYGQYEGYGFFGDVVRSNEQAYLNHVHYIMTTSLNELEVPCLDIPLQRKVHHLVYINNYGIMHREHSMRQIILEFEAAAKEAGLTLAKFKQNDTSAVHLMDHYEAAKFIVEAELFRMRDENSPHAQPPPPTGPPGSRSSKVFSEPEQGEGDEEAFDKLEEAFDKREEMHENDLVNIDDEEDLKKTLYTEICRGKVYHKLIRVVDGKPETFLELLRDDFYFAPNY